MFRKDAYLDDRLWFEPRFWKGDVLDDNAKRPWEIACHEAMTPTGNVVGLRHSQISHQTFSYRMYLEWAPHSDLETLIGGHRSAGSYVPEPMVWYVAERLAQAGRAMEGVMLHTPQPWDEIVHRQVALPGPCPTKLMSIRDLKPLNIFLGAPNPNDYYQYPKPLLGDFGLAFRTNQNDRFNPLWYNNRLGTPGFFAPEQTRWRDRNTLQKIHNWRLDHKTNVYGVGMVLYCMVMNRAAPDQPLWLSPGDGDGTLFVHNPHPTDPAYPANNYSTELTDLINRCLEFDPQNRPTFTVMYRYVRRQTGHGPGQPNLALGMRRGTATPVQQRAQATLHVQDKYRLGMALAAL